MPRMLALVWHINANMLNTVSASSEWNAVAAQMPGESHCAGTEHISIEYLASRTCSSSALQDDEADGFASLVVSPRRAAVKDMARWSWPTLVCRCH